MASTTIKGLTVEIGGDTTKLGKALQDVEKKSRNLSKELGDVNKLLKLDPGNADLVAQKQDILAKAVEACADKLETLKEAEKQVQNQFEKGEVSEEQVRALKREIVATENKMKGYQKAIKATAKAADGMGDDLEDAGDEVKDTGKESKTASKKVDDLADASKDAGKEGKGMGKALANAAKTGLKAVAAAAAAAIAGLVACAESSREYRTAMGKLDTAFTQSGFSAEAAQATYSDLVGILGDTDQAVEASNHLAQLCDTEEELATWTGDILPGVYATFGDSLPLESLAEAANETAKTGTVTGSLADALNWAGISEDEFNEKLAACSTEEERQALIMETLNGLYGDASEAYQETNAEVIRANQATDALNKSLAGIGGAIEPVITDFKLLAAELLSDLVPGVEAVSTAFRGVLNGEDGASLDLGAALADIIDGLLNKVTELAPTVVEVGMSLITTLVTTLISELPQLVTTGLQLVSSILTGVTQALPDITQALVDAIPGIASALETELPNIITGITNLVVQIANSMEQILPPLIEALPGVIESVVQSLLDNLPQLIDGLVSLCMAIVENLPVLLEALVPMIPDLITGICDSLSENLPTLLTGIVDLIGLLIFDVIPEAVRIIGENMPDIIDAVLAGAWDILTALNQWCLDMEAELVAWLDGVWESIKTWASTAWTNITTWFGNLISEASTKCSEFCDTVVTWLSGLPQKIWDAIVGAVTKVTTWGSNMATEASTACSNLLTNVRTTLSGLPGKVWEAISGAIDKVVSWGSDMATKAKEAMSDLCTKVKDGISGLPETIKTVGGDLVSGLWNGINDKFTWLTDQISGFTGGVLDKIKNFFGIESPSKKTAWMGRMLDEGFAVGILDNADGPIAAMEKVANGVLDAASVDLDANLNAQAAERTLQERSAKRAAEAAASSSCAITGMLDKILTAIEAGQVLAIDSTLLVGGTADKYDSALGMRRALVARGAL